MCSWVSSSNRNIGKYQLSTYGIRYCQTLLTSTSKRLFFQGQLDPLCKAYNTRPTGSTGGAQTMFTTSTIDKCRILQHHQFAASHLSKIYPSASPMVPFMVNINFGMYNIFPQIWRSHIVCDGESLSTLQNFFFRILKDYFFLYM